MSDSPEHIGRYQVESMLGEGNMGCVYKGHDPNLQRKVAIKTLNNRLKKSNAKESQSFKDRFFREAHANSQLNHPHIVAIYDSGIDGDAPFLVMEYIEGCNLDEALDHNPDLSYEERLGLMEQMAYGLDYAHEKGIVHRDIKPGNVLITADMQLKIVDFGLARLQDSRMTTTGVFLGTPSYASPEQIVNGEVESASDLFAFAIVVYETLFSKRPFPGENINSILFHIVHSDPDLDFKQIKNEAAPREVRKVFKKVFQKDPGKRYAKAIQFINELKAAFGLDPAQQSSAGVLSGSQRGSLKIGSAAELTELQQDETIRVSEPKRVKSRGGSLRRRKERNIWVPIGIVAVLALASLVALVLLVTKEPQKDGAPTQPQVTMSVNESKPSPALKEAFPGEEESEQEREAETEARQAAEQAAREAEERRILAEEARQQEIDELRKKFNNLVDKEKVLDAELTMLKLQALAVDITSQKRMLELLKTKRKQREDSRQLSKDSLRLAFTEAREARDLPAMRLALTRYEKNFPKDAVVIDTWRDILHKEEEVQQQVIDQARERLVEALLQKEPLLAEEQYNILATLGKASEEDLANVEQLKKDVWYNSIGMKFVRIPAGTYVRGNRHPENIGRDSDHHEVVLTTDIFMSATEVKQEHWRLVMNNNPSEVRSDNHPVTNVNWRDVRKFTHELKELEPGEFYRLPTEAEWEYAARAGTETPFFFGAVLSPENANFKESGFETSKPVASYPPNSFGLFDMHGNVEEWTSDTWSDYPKQGNEPLIDPSYEASGLRDRLRVVRGGSYDHSAAECASGKRNSRAYRHKSEEVGFRIVRMVPDEPESIQKNAKHEPEDPTQKEQPVEENGSETDEN